MREAADFKFRMRVTVGETIAVGPGKIALLEALAQTGSITSAAKTIGMSYRRAWLLIDELNRALREPAVSTAQGGSRGGGSCLTPNGERLVALYRSVEKKAMAHCSNEVEALKQLLS